jgi:serine/threonine protein kinase
MSAIEPLRPYVISDPLFYDRIELVPGMDDLESMLRERLGHVAAITAMGIWIRCFDRPMDELPSHGWKLHISGKPRQLRDILAAVSDEYLQEPFCFKVIRGSELGLAQLSRWWSRGGAGKAITVYPLNLEHAHELAERLTKRLADFEGAHILTDRRFPGSRTVHYRYGTFRTPAGVDADGHRNKVVTGPDGNPWSDDRLPRFTLPPWVSEDPFLPQAPDPAPATDFLRRYTVSRPLRQSTAGGVYLATDPSGAEVVLKEARPNTAFAPDGTDAVQRLHREHDVLRKLSGSELAPEAIEIAEVWEHTFLVQSYLAGLTLQVWIARNHPYAQGFTDSARMRDYSERVGNLITQLRTALHRFADAGIVYGDVSLTNIIVDDHDVLRLVDFESSRPISSDPTMYQHTSGFAPLETSLAWHDDSAFLDFAVAAVEAACISARNALLILKPRLFGQTIRHSLQAQDWPDTGLIARLETGAPGVADDTGDTPDLPRLIGDIVRHIRSTATPDRSDRLFPGHPELFASNPLSLAYGAAGVIRALYLLDGEVDDGHRHWLHSRLDSGAALPTGLYVGRAGIGLTLLETGDTERGTALLDTCAREAIRDDLPSGVASGLAGVGLALLAAADATGDSSWLEKAQQVGDRLSTEAQEDGTGLWWRPDQPSDRALGYLHGSAGVAAFLIELARLTEDPRMLRMGRRALAFDLERGRLRANGGIGFGATADGYAFEPYFGRGGAGVGMAVTRYVKATGDAELISLLDKIILGVAMPIAVYPGLFLGMTGLAEFLLDAAEVVPDNEQIQPALDRLVTEILALRSSDQSGTAFPGDGLMRFSCDLASGSAGIALLLQRLATGSPTLDVRYGESRTTPAMSGGPT